MGKSTKVVVPLDSGGALEYLDKGDGRAELVGVKASKRQASPGQAGGSPSPGAPARTPSPGAPARTPSPGGQAGWSGQEDLEALKAIDLVAFNSVAEQQFVELLDELVGQPVRVVKAEAAFRLKVSTETTKRYLEKWTAPSAPFAVVGGVVVRKRQ